MLNDFSGPRSYRPTIPLDPSDPPRFGQLTETLKDAAASELRRFLDYSSDDIRAKLKEFVTIEKFAHMNIGSSSADVSRSMETVVNLIMSWGDTPNKYPMIAITSSSIKEKVMGVGTVFAAAGQMTPRLIGSRQGPFALSPGMYIQVQTWPYGMTSDPQVTFIQFNESMFTNIYSVSVDELVNAINVQVLFVKARATLDGYLKLSSDGTLSQTGVNGIQIVGGSPECLAALGFVLDQSNMSSDYTVGPRSPVRRCITAGDGVLNIDVVSDDLNTRNDLADLVFQFFTFYMERQYFQWIGRSYQNEDLDPPEYYHIVLERKFSWSGEYSTPRQGGEQFAQVYSVRGSVPVIVMDYINRPYNRGPAVVETTVPLVLPPGNDYDVVHGAEDPSVTSSEGEVQSS